LFHHAETQTPGVVMVAAISGFTAAPSHEVP
jgi:hypothetical protein